jgi:hypothetical protein
MIIQALSIVLVIMVVSNIAVGVLNKASSSCSDGKDYFQGARNMPDGAVAGLGSIPTHVGFDYVGAARVATGVPGVIGLTSYPSMQKNGYLNNKPKTIEGYVTSMNLNTNDEDPSDSAVSNKATEAINSILQPGKTHKPNKDVVKVTADKAGSLNEFEVGMESIHAKNSDRKTAYANHRVLSHTSVRDGYEA